MSHLTQPRLPSIDQILAVEDSEDVLGYKCPHTGIPAWSTMRNRFLRRVIAQFYYTGRIDAPHDADIPTSRRIISLARYVGHNVTKAPKGDVCLMVSGRGLRQIDGRRWTNASYDPLLHAGSGSSFLVEDHFSWAVPLPRAYDAVWFNAPTQATATVLSRFLSHRHKRTAEDLVGLVHDRSRELLGWSPTAEEVGELEIFVAQKLASLPFYVERYTRLFRQSGARILLKEGAFYGPSAPAVVAAKALGMDVLEFQHGAFSKGHEAYNFAPAVLRNEAYRAIFPHKLLCFGEWWASQLDLPVEKIVIGNPNRQISSADDGACLDRRQVLVLGDGIDTNRYLGLCRAIARPLKQKGFNVAFRPHPLERSAASLSEKADFQIDRSADIYVALNISHTVISEASTGLFDAIGVSPNILVWRTPKASFTFPNHPFREFSDLDNLLALISGGEVGSRKVPAENFWAPHWEKNYNELMQSLVG